MALTLTPGSASKIVSLGTIAKDSCLVDTITISGEFTPSGVGAYSYITAGLTYEAGGTYMGSNLAYLSFYDKDFTAHAFLANGGYWAGNLGRNARDCPVSGTFNGSSFMSSGKPVGFTYTLTRGVYTADHSHGLSLNNEIVPVGSKAIFRESLTCTNAATIETPIYAVNTSNVAAQSNTAPYPYMFPVVGDFDSTTRRIEIDLRAANCTAVFTSLNAQITFRDGTALSIDLAGIEDPYVPPVIHVSGSSTSEAVGFATVTFTRTGDLSATDVVHATTRDGTAIAGSDYTAMSGDVVFGVGEKAKTFQIPIAQDMVFEGTEVFYIDCVAEQGCSVTPATATVSIAADTITTNDIFDLRRDNILRVDMPTDKDLDAPGQGTQFDGQEGQVITIHGGCNAKGGYYIYLDNRASRGPTYGDNTPGDFDDWRTLYQDGSTKMFMKQFIDESGGHYEMAVETCNSDGSWSRAEFNSPSTQAALAAPGKKEIHISKDGGEITTSIGWGNGTGQSTETKDTGGDSGGVENTYVYVACPGPPVCVDQGFLGYIEGITAEGWVDPSHTMSGGGTPTGTTPSGATVDMVPGSSGTSTPDLIDTVVFDTYRLIDKTVNAVTTEFVWDTKRITSVPAEVPLDGERDIVYIDEVVLDTFRLIGKTVNLITIEFLWDTKRIVSKTVEVGPLDTSRETSLTDWTSYDTSRETTGDRIADVTWDTKRTITTSDASTLIQVVGFDTKRTIIGDAINEVTFDTKRIIEGDEPGLPGVNIVFDTKRTITKSSDPVFIFDTKRKIKKEVTIYLDTKRFRNVTTIQTVRFDTKRRKTVTFWEIPEYDDYQ